MLKNQSTTIEMERTPTTNKVHWCKMKQWNNINELKVLTSKSS